MVVNLLRKLATIVRTKTYLSLYHVFVVVCVGADQLAVELGTLVSAGRRRRDLLPGDEVEVRRGEDLP